MSKFIMLLLSMNIIYIPAFAQSKYSLTGIIVDENSQALTGASVLLYPIKKGTITDAQGRYSITGLSKGAYKISISFIGYKTFIDSIIINENTSYNIQLTVSSVSLQEVVVSDNYARIRQREEPLNIEIVNDDYLKKNLGGSLMKSLERLPGVTTIDIGYGRSKPVIRGLGFNRVVVIENSIKHEGQQWGSDHGLEIDQYSIDNVEVIKGPASLMYGSDAIGGVIDLKNKNIPVDNTIGGTIDITGKSNNNMLGTSVSLFGRKEWFFTDFRATFTGYGDNKVPTDSIDIYSYRAPLYKNYLRNTAGKEQNIHLSIGIIKPEFQSKVYLSNVYGKSGFFANAHGLEPRNVDTELHDKSGRDINYPYHQVNHFKLINISQWQWGKYKFESGLGFQRNFRQEWSQYVSHGYMPALFPDTLGFDADLERLFDKYIYSGNLKLSFFQKEKTLCTVGVNSEYQDNRISGRGFIIPAFKLLNIGGYAFAKHSFSDKSILQLGIRYDYGYINTLIYNDWFPSPVISNNDPALQYLTRADAINRSFSNISWSVGYNYNLQKISFKTNIGKSFRMPLAKELAANGVNYHNFSYEVGDPDLSPEISYQTDAGIEYNSDKFAIGVTPFLNYFSKYIYLNPTSEHDRLYGNGNQVYYYTQSAVFRFGGEIHAHYQVLKSLQLGVMGEYVYSEQLSGDKKGFTLPFSPPPSGIFNVKYQKQKIKFLENAYLSVDYRISSAQNNIVPPEERTDGYQLINIVFGGVIRLINQEANFSFQIQNLLNSKYFNHTSYYRLINVPEPGRNFVLNISIPFLEKINQK